MRRRRWIVCMDYNCGFLTVGIGGFYGQVHEGLVCVGVDRNQYLPVCDARLPWSLIL